MVLGIVDSLLVLLLFELLCNDCLDKVFVCCCLLCDISWSIWLSRAVNWLMIAWSSSGSLGSKCKAKDITDEHEPNSVCFTWRCKITIGRCRQHGRCGRHLGALNKLKREVDKSVETTKWITESKRVQARSPSSLHWMWMIIVERTSLRLVQVRMIATKCFTNVLYTLVDTEHTVHWPALIIRKWNRFESLIAEIVQDGTNQRTPLFVIGNPIQLISWMNGSEKCLLDSK